MLTLTCKKEHLFLRIPPSGCLLQESLFNFEYCEIFKSTYFEEHLRTAASENVFIKTEKN